MTVGEVIQSLVGDFYNPLYLRDSRYNSIDSDDFLGVNKGKRPKTTRGLTRRVCSRMLYLHIDVYM